MGQVLVDRWLDGELEFEGMLGLEKWLREDPKHSLSFAEQVQLGENLYAHFNRSDRKLPVVRISAMRFWSLATISLAASLLIAFGMVFYFGSTRPTIDPQLVVLNGEPRIEIVESDPDPAPFPIATSDSPQDTVVTTSKQPCIVRWRGDYVFELDSSTTLKLRSSSDIDDENSLVRIALDQGKIRVKIVAVTKAFELMANASRVRVAAPVEFTLTGVASAPGSDVKELRVTKGFIDLLGQDGRSLRVEAGETIILP